MPRVSAPRRTTIENVHLSVISKLGWIKKQQGKLLPQERATPREFLERESHFVWGRRYLLRLEEGRPGVESGHRDIVLRVDPGSSTQQRQEAIDEWYRRELRIAAVPLVHK